MKKSLDIEDILFKSRDIFFHFVNECNERYRSNDDLDYYRKIVQAHRKINNIEDILKDESFIIQIRETLVKWDMDKRTADLQSIEIIKRNILAHENILKYLYNYKLHKVISLTNDEGENIFKKIKFVFKELGIMKSKRQIVGGSKTLHFLLPDLVLPIDGKYTMNYFYGDNKYSDKIDTEFEIFKDIFIRSHKIANKLNLCESDIDGVKWNTSIPKLIDNAIIGFSQEFESFIDQSQDDCIDNFINSLSKYTSFTLHDKSQLKNYLEDRRRKYINSERKKIKDKLILIKAKEAGLIVTEEEIDNYLARKH